MSNLYDKKAVKILFDTYWTSGGWRDSYVTTPADFAYAISTGVMFPPALLPHDATLQRLRKLCDSISPVDVGRAFLASFSRREPGLRSALGSFAVARYMPDHAFEPNIRTCRICNLHQAPTESERQDLNVLNFERLKWGGVRHWQAAYQVFDLSEFKKLPVLEPTAEDLEIFRRLLATIRSLPATATVGVLEKELAAVVPSNRNERRQLIEVLCLCGVTAYPGYRHAFDFTPPPNDRPYRDTDWGGQAMYWRGGDSYCVDRVKEYFPIALPFVEERR